MPEFLFRLQTLLDQKLDMETKARAAVVEQQRIFDEQQAFLLQSIDNRNRIERSISRARDELLLTAVPNKGADVLCRNQHLVALKQDLSAAHEQMLIQKFAVEEAEANLMAAQTHALECWREAEKLSKYKERLETRFFADAAKKEELEQTELGTTMYRSRRASE